MTGPLLILAAALAPTGEDVRKAMPLEHSRCGSQDLAEECERIEFVPIEVRDLACNDTQWPREYACSYNVLMGDEHNLAHPFWRQRVDQFRLMEDGSWFHVRQVEPPRHFG